jgi:hypothetical protein
VTGKTLEPAALVAETRAGNKLKSILQLFEQAYTRADHHFYFKKLKERNDLENKKSNEEK